MPGRLTVLAVAAAVTMLAGAALQVSGGPTNPAGAGGDARGAGGDERGAASGQVLTVVAAASLGEAFEVLADGFESAHPGLTVRLSLGPSQALAAQVAAGAPADVLATADPATMAIAVEAWPGTTPVVFARNRVALAVAPGADVDSLADLTRVPFALCRPEVPCGAAGERVLAAAGVTADPVTFSTDVAAVLTQVVWGQVDAGLVYASDVRPTAPVVQRGRVRAVAVPDDLNSVSTYPVAALPDATVPALARAFVDHVLSDDGARVLADAGFMPP
ncbi:molybdate ABC transporter substrate-binding protein [Cellulomonas sp. ATA003]|uniref:molybdate ABC transporter substrate-binding protein n=1 Tax=Cellulomonas sp. ATA003 TaxID=3073064 RepID=UPI002873994B|nr:molybdate ABC transporter substrate-binding protein [Cellulomonas sp. ATA003]WNB87238.1 molybdate ABC transporter substrate-binding protein [Cellulomonas sp. ATA003]